MVQTPWTPRELTIAKARARETLGLFLDENAWLRLCEAAAQNADYGDTEIVKDLQQAREDLAVADAADASMIGPTASTKVIGSLTRRQRQTMVLIIVGKPHRVIAVDLLMGQRTVENHRAVPLRKMGSNLSRRWRGSSLFSEPLVLTHSSAQLY